MPIYDKPVRALIPEMIAALAPEPGQVFTKHAAIKWFNDRYPKIKQGTITAHLIRFSTNAAGRLHHNFQPDEDLLFQIDGTQFRRYDPANDPAPIHEKPDIAPAPPGLSAGPDEEPVTAGMAQAASEFAYESDLRDFLAKNLFLIELGLQLYQDEGITGIEFPVGGRFIDILAVDSEKRFVVIELKVSRGYDRVVGQLLRYMAWIREHHAEPGQAVRGVIAAREISDDLRLACSYLKEVSLYEYELSIKLQKISLPSSQA